MNINKLLSNDEGLIEFFMPVIQGHALKLRDYADGVQEGVLQLLRAAKSFDATKGPLVPYFALRLMGLRDGERDKAKAGEQSLEALEEDFDREFPAMDHPDADLAASLSLIEDEISFEAKRLDGWAENILNDFLIYTVPTSKDERDEKLAWAKRFFGLIPLVEEDVLTVRYSERIQIERKKMAGQAYRIFADDVEPEADGTWDWDEVQALNADGEPDFLEDYADNKTGFGQFNVSCTMYGLYDVYDSCGKWRGITKRHPTEFRMWTLVPHTEMREIWHAPFGINTKQTRGAPYISPYFGTRGEDWSDEDWKAEMEEEADFDEFLAYQPTPEDVRHLTERPTLAEATSKLEGFLCKLDVYNRAFVMATLSGKGPSACWQAARDAVAAKKARQVNLAKIRKWEAEMIERLRPLTVKAATETGLVLTTGQKLAWEQAIECARYVLPVSGLPFKMLGSIYQHIHNPLADKFVNVKLADLTV